MRCGGVYVGGQSRWLMRGVVITFAVTAAIRGAWRCVYRRGRLRKFQLLTASGGGRIIVISWTKIDMRQSKQNLIAAALIRMEISYRKV